MSESEFRQKLESFLKQLSPEDLEEKVAPLDCTKKPQHPDCAPPPPPPYGGPRPFYGGP
jgi:hypothetical protein